MRMPSWVRGGVTAVLCALLSAGSASAQVYSGGVTTATSIAPSTVLPLGVTATTVTPFSDSSAAVATDQFVQARALIGQSFTPFTGITGGTYSFATLGSGAIIVFSASSGVLSGIITVGLAGSGYAVGDILTPMGGNTDAYVRVTGVSSGGVTSAQIIYGGTGYNTGGSLQLSPAKTFPAVFSASGVLTSNVTVIIPNGSFLLGGQERTVANNTTGAFTTTLCVSNGANACTGATLLIPQGTANNTPIYWFTDGSTGVWQINNAAAAGAATQGTSGSWTPADASGAGLTFAGVSAAYTQIGNIVFAYATLNYPATANSSSAKISGLPVAVPSSTYAQQCSPTISSPAGNVKFVPQVSSNTLFLMSATGGAVTNATMTGSVVSIMCIYPAS